ncbi:MAG: hypothetical protein HQ552_09895 [Desulfobacteraceae bacterium]|nr:hypothetical protein [Desulfobacteraceae bacterium]
MQPKNRFAFVGGIRELRVCGLRVAGCGVAGLLEAGYGILDTGKAPVALVEERPASTWPPSLKLRRAKRVREKCLKNIRL